MIKLTPPVHDDWQEHIIMIRKRDARIVLLESALAGMLKAYHAKCDLLVCYRLSKRPTNALWAQLAMCHDAENAAKDALSNG